MRIGVDVSPLLGTRAGVGTYVEQLVQALVALSPQHRYSLYTPRGLAQADAAVLNKYPNVTIVRCPSVLMGWRAWWDRVDIFHGMNYKLRGTGRAGTVVTIHDLALDRVPQSSRKLFGQRRSFVRSRRTALRASRVVAVSRQTALDIEELYGVPRERIAVIPNGPGVGFFPMTDKDFLKSVKKRYGIPREGFVLATGGAHPRKNILRVIEAFGQAPELRETLNLVVLGGMEQGSKVLYEAVRRAGLEGDVLFPGHVPIEDLRALYSSCAVFVFPSLYEGFGMPVLEAMACGAPVVCSNTSALPEVVGDAAVLVSPMDSGAVSEALKRVVRDQDLREELRRRGFLRVKAFSWERSAAQVLEVYEDLHSRGAA